MKAIVTQEFVSVLQELVEDGWTQCLIADYFELSRSYIRDLIYKYCYE